MNLKEKRLGQDAQNVAFFHDQQLFAVDSHFCAGPFAEQDFVTFFDGHRDQLTAVLACAFTSSNNHTFRRLFFCGLRDDQATRCFFFALHALDQYTVMKWFKCHLCSSLASSFNSCHSLRASANER